MVGYLVCVFVASRLFWQMKVLNENKGTNYRHIMRMPQVEVEEAGNPTRKGRQEVVEVDPMLTLLLLFLVLLVLLVLQLLSPLNLEVPWRRMHSHSTPRPGQ